MSGSLTALLLVVVCGIGIEVDSSKAKVSVDVVDALQRTSISSETRG